MRAASCSRAFVAGAVASAFPVQPQYGCWTAAGKMPALRKAEPLEIRIFRERKKAMAGSPDADEKEYLSQRLAVLRMVFAPFRQPMKERRECSIFTPWSWIGADGP
jgi:hypothetical protein